MRTAISAWLGLLLGTAAFAGQAGASPRTQVLLSDTPWQFTSTAAEQVDSPELAKASWLAVNLPHVFWSRVKPQEEVLSGWYRRDLDVAAGLGGKRLFLVFEGVGTVADVYVNGRHLGQHRGAYTRFLFDATDALHAGRTNALAVRADNSPAAMKDCLPDGSRLYKVWGGIYRKVWLVAADPVHIDPTDCASPGIYITPRNVSEASAELAVKVLLRNTTADPQTVDVRATLLDPAGKPALTLTGPAKLAGGGRDSVTLDGRVERPRLWSPATPEVYRVQVDVLSGQRVLDSVVEPTGFRTIAFEDQRVTLNGKPTVLVGANIHQEIESKAAAMADEDFRENVAMMKDLGFNWVRLAHYPHARLEYDLCDRLGLLCWAENGHTNRDQLCDNTRQINAEMVKQNYNHPSIAVWSVGNEAGAEPAEAFVPLVKSLDASRPVVAANMRCGNADFVAANTYAGWYGGEMWAFKAVGYVSETGAGGVTSTHCDYAAAKPVVNKYEPEEYQQLFAESHLQIALRRNDALGMFTWWTMRDFNNRKYKAGWNTKGLLTYAGDKKDVYYLFRCFVNPSVPTVHLTSKRYFLRTGAADNGIKAYSNALELTLTLNGATVSTLRNGQYRHANGNVVDNVFHWPVKLRTGKNTATVADSAAHADSAVVYFYGDGGQAESPDLNPLVKGLTTGNPRNRAYYMDMPIQAQWPFYHDLDSTADNSFDALPPAIQGATWIATRRHTKSGQEADISFTLTRAATVYVMCTRLSDPPEFLTAAGFTAVSIPDLRWRDNDLFLVPAQLYGRQGRAGDTIRIANPRRDAVILFKAPA